MTRFVESFLVDPNFVQSLVNGDSLMEYKNFYKLCLKLDKIKFELFDLEVFNENARLRKENTKSLDSIKNTIENGFELFICDLNGNILKEKFYFN